VAAAVAEAEAAPDRSNPPEASCRPGKSLAEAEAVAAARGIPSLPGPSFRPDM